MLLKFHNFRFQRQCELMLFESQRFKLHSIISFQISFNNVFKHSKNISTMNFIQIIIFELN